MTRTDAVVVEAVRTPFVAPGGTLATYPSHALMGHVIAELGQRHPGLPRPTDVIVGQSRGPGGNMGRISALAGGLPLDTAGYGLDAQCGSGLVALQYASWAIRSGAATCVVAGGVESPSTFPGPHAAQTYRDRAAFAPPGFADPEMGCAADDLASRLQISRAAQDQYALASHERALTARDAGHFCSEIMPLDGVSQDSRPRRLKAATIARFAPVFSAEGSVTSATAAGYADGAAGLVVTDTATQQRLGLPGLAIRAIRTIGCDTALPGWGPIAAVEAILPNAAVTLHQVDRIEINEAFSVVVLAATERWGLTTPQGQPLPHINTYGGALAWGHPWAASGAAIVGRLFNDLVRRDQGRWGVAACAIGGGMGVAALVERVSP